MARYTITRTGNYYGITDTLEGKLVLADESFTIVDNTCDALNGRNQPSGECAEVAAAIGTSSAGCMAFSGLTACNLPIGHSSPHANSRGITWPGGW